METEIMRELHRLKEELDKISPTFCVAKWKQVTMHLESGLTHSCHHPKAHIVPLHELVNNPSALHNTNYKKGMRKLMLEGKIVPECEYCNRVEQKKTGSLSDRVFKSGDHWAKKYIPEILENPYDYDVFPSYFEVSFSSVCNCHCLYCSSTFSSGWSKEIEEFGPYDVSISTRSFDQDPKPQYLDQPVNPYIEAFWRWWPDLYQNLEEFRITGGEPLLSKETYKVLDHVIENPKPDLNLSINSNFCIKPKIFRKFIDKYKRIGNLQKVSVYTSGEAHGKRAEYIRPGMNYDEWMNNCQTYLREVPNSRLIFMCTYNILSITSFKDFLGDIKKLKEEFPNRVGIDIPFLMNPPYLQANIITKNFIKYVEDSVTYMYRNHDVAEWRPMCGNAFFDFETAKLLRIFHMIVERPEDHSCNVSRVDFAKFVDQNDERYGRSFVKTFPEYEDFYNHCKEIVL